MKIISSWIIFIFLIPYTASLYNGLSRLFGMAFDIDYKICVVAMAVLTGIYVIVGGYMATAINDFIQGLIMLVGIVAVIYAVLNERGGLTGALDKLARVNDPAVSDTPGVFASFLGPDIFNLVCVVILTSLGTWGLPQMIQKFYAIKDEKSIKTGTIVSTLFATIVAGGCYFLGGFGRLTETDVATEGFDAIIPHLLENLPEVLMGLVVILVLSASMSTLSSLVLTSVHTYDRLYQSIDRTENVREEAGPYNADHAGSIYRIIGGHCSHSVFQQGGIYRTAYGYFMGCDRRCLSGSVFIWSVLETHDSGSLPCKFYLGRRHHDTELYQ